MFRKTEQEVESSKPAIIAIDQGTTSSRAILFDDNFQALYCHSQEITQHYPQDGWVEHDGEEIWQSVVSTMKVVLNYAQEKGYEAKAIGLTNQRETALIWDRETGRPIHHALVWQDRRTAKQCAQLKESFGEEKLNAKTGLLFDPYFSATKVAWILDHVPGARERAQKGELCFGTIDSFLIYKLTGGQHHVTDITNASRTNLFNIRTKEWDAELLTLFDIPQTILPQVKDCTAEFGITQPGLFGQVIPILGVAGDQQAASIGQGCFDTGDIKSTYGTGCFVLLNTKDEIVASKHRLLTTIAYKFEDQLAYALEGSIFVAGAAIQWLRDEMKILASAPESEAAARSLKTNEGVYLVPAFTGLGAPWWDPDARGALFGLTRDTGPNAFIRAALESVVYQTKDLLNAMEEDGVGPIQLKVDGGMVNNDWLCQFLSDILDLDIIRPKFKETTALGAAYLAGFKTGLYPAPQEFKKQINLDQTFTPSMNRTEREDLLAGWRSALNRTLS